MGNVLAIAHKELRAYFASPIAYVIIGGFAFLYGYFFVAILSFFVRQSMQMMQMGGPPTANINEMMIRPLMQNVTVLVLFVMPMITMRTYSEEKRSGTIELLLTSPLTDVQIVLGKFLGAMALYGVMLAVTLIHVAILFVYGNPEWKPIATAYLGLLLLGGSFISLGLFISSLTKNQIVAAMITFAVFLLPVDHHVDRTGLGTDGQRDHDVSFDHRPRRGLLEGRHRYDAPRLLPELHYVWPVSDRQVGRQ